MNCRGDSRPATLRHPTSRAGLGTQPRARTRDVRSGNCVDRRSPDANELLPLASNEGLEPQSRFSSMRRTSPASCDVSVCEVFAGMAGDQFALSRQRAARFIDLPHVHRFADSQETEDDEPLRGDPLRPLALPAGYGDTERWWDHLVESRRGADLDVFGAVHEMMSALRAGSSYRRRCWNVAEKPGCAVHLCGTHRRSSG